jgi:hypothetical protein
VNRRVRPQRPRRNVRTRNYRRNRRARQAIERASRIAEIRSEIESFAWLAERPDLTEIINRIIADRASPPHPLPPFASFPPVIPLPWALPQNWDPEDDLEIINNSSPPQNEDTSLPEIIDLIPLASPPIADLPSPSYSPFPERPPSAVSHTASTVPRSPASEIPDFEDMPYSPPYYVWLDLSLEE